PDHAPARDRAARHADRRRQRRRRGVDRRAQHRLPHADHGHPGADRQARGRAARRQRRARDADHRRGVARPDGARLPDSAVRAQAAGEAMKRAIALACSLAAALTAARAPADGHFVVRMATVAPDGTAYARELRAFSREVADATQGEVSMKWYWGGIAGYDRQVAERVKRGQLDGVASGMICQLVAPSFRA